MFYLLNSEYIFWLAWIIIPFIVEFVPAIGNFLFLITKYQKKKKAIEQYIEYYPEITIIIPVYNSQDTLKKCIQSINDSTYDNSLITVMLVDNGTKDNSYMVFEECVKEYTDLNMFWITSNQGKSKALNKALFNSTGKYIINIDSDGRLEKNALKNVVLRFENNMDIHCITGVISIEQKEIDETPKGILKITRKLEFMEYCQAFLAGRNYNSEFNNLFTISGAFSAFRKSTILQTFMYNTNTICEDAHITFQIKQQHKKVALCENAFYYVSPIDDLNKMYTQRQRWQIGELEVFHMFFRKGITVWRAFKNKTFRNIFFDHTFAFPKFIWYFALIALNVMNFSLKYMMKAMFFLYVLYVINNILFYFIIQKFLNDFPDDKKYHKKHFLYLFLLPIYNMVIFFVRLSGIINSTARISSWKTYTLNEELQIAKNIIQKDFSIFRKER